MVVRFSFGEVCVDVLWLAMVSSVVAELKNKESDINCGDNDIGM